LKFEISDLKIPFCISLFSLFASRFLLLKKRENLETQREKKLNPADHRAGFSVKAAGEAVSGARHSGSPKAKARVSLN
jgi:hypothetical protein